MCEFASQGDSECNMGVGVRSFLRTCVYETIGRDGRVGGYVRVFRVGVRGGSGVVGMGNVRLETLIACTVVQGEFGFGHH